MKLRNLLALTTLGLASLVGGCQEDIKCTKTVTPIAYADFDKDGKKDVVGLIDDSDSVNCNRPIKELAIINGNDIKDNTYENLKGKLFVVCSCKIPTKNSYSLGVHPKSVKVKDINGDGNIDFQFTTHGGTYTFLNDGKGNLWRKK
ncbi:MAG: hypothetical protein KJ939_06910 [Nanoarchaeota archaeon]|nr:hypothetical protein [Nanoarchaeota archaeon]